MIKAVVLCAGFGTRLGELTQHTPKPMLHYQNKPLLEFTIQQLKAAGVSSISINLHYLGEQIENYFADGRKWNVKIHYSFELKPSGTAGGVRSLEHHLQDCDHFFVIYGDLYFEESLAKLISFHQEHGKEASIFVHEREKSNSVVEIDKNGLVTKFLERPAHSLPGKKMVNSGIYLFKSSILKRIAPIGESDFPRDIFPQLVEEKELFALPLEGFRVAIDSPERYLSLQKRT
jgi:NDP-sugar pyrophosphorylase family protein